MPVYARVCKEKNMSEGVARKIQLKIDQYVRLHAAVVDEILRPPYLYTYDNVTFRCTVIKYIVVDMYTRTRQVIECIFNVSGNGNQTRNGFFLL